MQIEELGYQILSHLTRNSAQNERLGAAFQESAGGGFFSRWGRTAPASDNAIHTEDIEALAEIAALDAEDKLNRAFSAAGIAAYPPVELSVGEGGGITAGNHPDKAKIEKLLRDHTGLARDLRGAMVLQEHAATFKQYRIFLDHYNHAYRKGKSRASNAIYARFMGFAKPHFSYIFGLQGFTTRIGGAPLAEWLADTNRALSYA